MDGGGNTEPHHVRIDRKLQRTFPTKSLNCSIFKVPGTLRKVNEAAYEPQAISIGPYHHGKDHLKTMEVFKLFYLDVIRRRTNGTSVERYVKALDHRKEEARRYYSEPLDHFGGDEKFVEMMLLDGCFIVELIHASFSKKQQQQQQQSLFPQKRVRKDPLLSHYILRTVLRDLLLVENQLPLFILGMLFEMTVPGQPKNFLEMAIKLFSINNIIPGSPETITGMEKHIRDVRDVEHLLGLLHDKWIGYEIFFPPGYSWLKSPEIFVPPPPCLAPPPPCLAPPPPCLAPPPPCSAPVPPDYSFLKSPEEVNSQDKLPSSSSEGESSASEAGDAVGFHSAPRPRRDLVPLFRMLLGMSNGKCPFIPSATELNEAGVNFKKMQGRSSLFDITFDKGVLSIPTLEIRDETESVLRNLVAYEQCNSDSSLGSNAFTDYVTFIDCLINTEKDVKLLCKHGIIVSWLGDYQVVTAIFNRIRDYVLIDEKHFRYAETFEQLNLYSNRDWIRCMAKLKLWMANYNHFNTPWAAISFVAAFFLLLLTMMQSIYAALSYHHPKK